MLKIISLFVLCLITLSVSANNNNDVLSVVKIKHGQTIPKSAPMNVLLAELKGNQLFVTVKYRGSRNDSIKIYWNGVIRHSNPPQSYWHLVRHPRGKSNQIIYRRLVCKIDNIYLQKAKIYLYLNWHLLKRLQMGIPSITRYDRSQELPKSPPIHVMSSKIRNNHLILTVKYRGSHEDSFKIYWNGIYLRSNPPQVNFHLVRHPRGTTNQWIERRLVYNIKGVYHRRYSINLYSNWKLITWIRVN